MVLDELAPLADIKRGQEASAELRSQDEPRESIVTGPDEQHPVAIEYLVYTLDLFLQLLACHQLERRRS